MTNMIQSFDYNGQVISQREDGFISLTQMCQANGKLTADFLRLKTTKAYVDELSVAMGIPIGEIVIIQNGSQTWGHKLLAIRCAQWISPKFAVWCDQHIFNLMTTGHAELIEKPQLPQTYLEALKALVAVEEEKQLLLAENQILESQNHHLSEVVDELFDYSSIVRIAKFNNIHESNFKWQRLKAVSQQMGLEIKKVPDARYEYKLLYSHNAWRVAYPNARLPETTTLVIQR